MFFRYFTPVLILATFGNFFYFLLCSNIFDWDHAYAFMEVDRRIWLETWRPPVWSYQLCAGTTRIADPQTFAYSPVFLFVLLFGTVLGTKLMTIFSAAFGYYYLRKIFMLLTDNNHQGIGRAVLYNLLPLFFIFSNFYHAQHHIGHYTFLFSYLFLMPVYYILKSCIAKTNKKEFFWALFVLVSIFLGCFYHAVVFFIMPFCLAISLYFLYEFFFRKKSLLAIPGLKNTFLLFFFAFIISLVRLIPVYKYQSQFPLVREGFEIYEYRTLWDVVKILFIPAENFTKYFFNLHSSLWGTFESTAFSFAYIIFIFFIPYIVLRIFKKRGSASLGSKLIFPFLLIYLILSLAFMFGNFSAFSPLWIVNQSFFGGGIRVVPRFSVSFSLAFFLFIVFMTRSMQLKKTHLIVSIASLLLMNLYFYYPYNTLAYSSFKEVYNYSKNNVSEMKEVAVVPPQSILSSHDFRAVQAGKLISNCYLPITREEVVADQLEGIKDQYVLYPLVEYSDTRNPRECIDGIAVNQSEIIIPDSCKYQVCLNLNSIKSSEKQRGFYFDAQRNRYCFTR